MRKKNFTTSLRLIDHFTQGKFDFSYNRCFSPCPLHFRTIIVLSSPINFSWLKYRSKSQILKRFAVVITIAIVSFMPGSNARLSTQAQKSWNTDDFILIFLIRYLFGPTKIFLSGLCSRTIDHITHILYLLMLVSSECVSCLGNVSYLIGLHCNDVWC